jgi:hypothetical protein
MLSAQEGDDDATDATDSDDASLDVMSGSEEEPDTCACCTAEGRVLRTARDCCQSGVCADCIRISQAGCFCKDCYGANDCPG